VLCRYEDLVVESEPVLRALLDWLGEPWSPDVLAHHRVQREKGAPRVVDGSTSTRDRIDPARAASWQQALTPSDVDVLQPVAPLASFLGYESATSPGRTAPGPGPAGRRWLMDGDELAERRLEWSDRVDFDQQPPTLSIDASPEELAARLAQVEQALARTRSRRSVRASEAFRKVQRGRSVQDLRDAWAVLRGLRR
jgi:hypothetical protein